MAYEIHTLIDAGGAPADAQTRFDDWYSNHGFVLTDRERSYTENSPREDGTLQGYREFRVFLSLREDPANAESDLETAFPDASWMVVNTRRVDDELAQEPWASDETYHAPGLSDGLRAAVGADFDGHALTHGDIHYTVDGADHSVPAGEYTFEEPDGKTTKTLYADKDGLNTNGGVEVATVEVHPGRIVNIDGASQPTASTGWTTDIERGSPPSHFVNETEAYPDREPSDPFDRAHISDSEEQAIYDAIEGHSDPETASLAKEIVDIVFGNK